MDQNNTLQKRRPLVRVTLCFMGGILAGTFLPVPFKIWLVIPALGTGVALFWPRRPVIATAALLLAIFSCAAGYTAYRLVPSPGHVDGYLRRARGRPVSVEGRIVSPVRRIRFFTGYKRLFVVETGRVKTSSRWRTTHGRLQVQLFREADLVYGDRVTLTGKAHRPFDGDGRTQFSYRRYLADRGIRFVISVGKEGAVEQHAPSRTGFMARMMILRRVLSARLEQYVLPPESGVMQAILLGERSGIPRHWRTMFSETGTMHVLAISGLHIGLIAFLFHAVLQAVGLNRSLRLVVLILLLAGYACLTGGRPSVIRATVMTVVFLTGLLLDREADSLNLLAAAAMLQLIYRPLLLFDCGFQLSFAAVAVILLLYPVGHDRVAAMAKRHRMPALLRSLMQTVWVSLCAWLGTAGFIAYYFGVVTPVGLLANVVIVPLLTVVIALGLTLLAAGGWAPAGLAFGVCLKVVISGFLLSVYLFYQIPLGAFSLRDVAAWQVAVYYTGVAVMIGWVLTRRKSVKNGIYRPEEDEEDTYAFD